MSKDEIKILTREIDVDLRSDLNKKFPFNCPVLTTMGNDILIFEMMDVVSKLHEELFNDLRDELYWDLDFELFFTLRDL